MALGYVNGGLNDGSSALGVVLALHGNAILACEKAEVSETKIPFLLVFHFLFMVPEFSYRSCFLILLCLGTVILL